MDLVVLVVFLGGWLSRSLLAGCLVGWACVFGVSRGPSRQTPPPLLQAGAAGGTAALREELAAAAASAVAREEAAEAFKDKARPGKTEACLEKAQPPPTGIELPSALIRPPARPPCLGGPEAKGGFRHEGAATAKSIGGADAKKKTHRKRPERPTT